MQHLIVVASSAPGWIHSFYLGQRLPPLHRGIGSLPSAINIGLSAWIAELPAGGAVFGIAQYNPASAKAVNSISMVLFMGESPRRNAWWGDAYATRLYARVACG